ncbi:MAG: hypothetical protein R6X34_16910 [Chloroflexota bacterium]
MEHKDLIEWKASVEKFIISDIQISLNHDFLEVGLIILTMIGIDCLGGYYVGKPADADTFKAFLESIYFPKPYHQMSADLFYLRNGLVHDYTSKNGKFIFFRNQGDGATHLQPYVGNQYPIVLNRQIFAQDFLAAWEMYSRDVFQRPDLAEKALKRTQATGKGFFVVEWYSGGTVPWSNRNVID